MINYAVFLAVILLANIIQGITGFAGTILAMPPSLMLVGYPVAKPVLNVLGLLSGLYVFAGQRRNVCWSELKKIVAVMAVGIAGGILLKGLFEGREQILYRGLGLFVILLSLQGGMKLWREQKQPAQEPGKDSGGEKHPLALGLLLLAAGIVHGIFVSGGPLLISYLTKRISDKNSFRATISTIWVFLNTLILVDDIRAGFWNWDLIRIQLAAIPFLLAGMVIGSWLYVRMSQKLFMAVTYILLFLSGISLIVK